MAYTKVFAGNLSFRTTEDQLAEQFQAAGKVVSANIITRGPRSLGYGFVEFENEKDAQSAVDLLNKKNIDGRDINVELAKPREEKQPQTNSDQPPQRRRGGGRGRGGRGRGGGRGGANNNNSQNNQAANSQSDNNAPRENRPRRGRGPRNNNNNNNNNSPSQGQSQSQEGDVSPPQASDFNTRPRGRGRGRGGRGRGGRGGRGGRYNRAPRQSVESTTSLFVANLPFDLDDAKLLELFKEHKATGAHVVTNYQGRSRGFGFVEFDEKDQKAAFDSANQNQIVVTNRPLTVKIALVEEKQTPVEGDASNQTPAQQN